MVARLQAAIGSKNPILMRDVDRAAGGQSPDLRWGADMARAFAFLFHELGIRLEAPKR